MVSEHVHDRGLVKMGFCFLKPNILAKHYWVEREPSRSPRGLIQGYAFPQAKVMLPYHAKVSYYKAIFLREETHRCSKLWATGFP